jgi:aminoglycoside phosphotransferase (APT) family kinase protein
LGERREVFGPIHCDLNLSNLVFSRAGVGVLDFDLSGLGHYLLDLAALRTAAGQLPGAVEATCGTRSWRATGGRARCHGPELAWNATSTRSR